MKCKCGHRDDQHNISGACFYDYNCGCDGLEPGGMYMELVMQIQRVVGSKTVDAAINILEVESMTETETRLGDSFYLPAVHVRMKAGDDFLAMDYNKDLISRWQQAVNHHYGYGK